MADISIIELIISLAPLLMTGLIYWHWTEERSIIAWASARMLAQLLFMGYLLLFIFKLDHPLWVGGVIAVMTLGASWISTRPIRGKSIAIGPLMAAVTLSGFLHLCWIVFFVLQPDPWYAPHVVIPITGMVMANAMNAVSQCAERFWSDVENGMTYKNAANSAFQAAMIPQINTFMAVGIVSLPGMMTGQILSGVSPLIAVRYQIVIMAMVMGTAALGSSLYLLWNRR